jgi:cell division septum initiation protein DivIVA
MKKTFLLIPVCLLIFSVSSFSQNINTDSLALISKISSDKLKLGKLQNEIEQKTKNKMDASMQAQKSANENTNAANKLSDDPQNKKLARQADNKAGDAKSEARNARKEERRLDNLNKDIRDLKNKIADAELKMKKYTMVGTTN